MLAAETRYQHIVLDQSNAPLIGGTTILAYYWDHAEEIDRDIERRLEHVEKLRRETALSVSAIWRLSPKRVSRKTW